LPRRFWLDATSKATIERSFEGIAGELNRPRIRLLEDTESKVKFVLDTIQDWEDQWLIVYDNYARPDMFLDIKGFLPKSESIYLLSAGKLIASDGQEAIMFTNRHEATKVLGRHILLKA
jgi:hypothetical protein